MTDTIETTTNGSTMTEYQQAIAAAKESFSGKTLTESQFNEAWAISKIIHQEINKRGTFREKLTDYSHAFARSEKFDAMRAENILRDVYGGRYSQSMNHTREALMAKENALAATPDTQSETQVHALKSAEAVEGLIKEGRTQPFYKAYDIASQKLASKLKITQTGAKALMQAAYKAQHDRDLYDQGKEVEGAYHKPVREAEIAARKAEKMENNQQTQSHSRSMG